MNSSIDFGWKNKGYSNVFSNNSITLKTAVAKQPVSVSLWASVNIIYFIIFYFIIKF